MSTSRQKPYISQSQLTMYERCGEQYRRRYIENERIPPGIAMAKGIGVHNGAKVNFHQKIESHEDLPHDEIIEAAVAEYETVVNKGILLTPEEETVGVSRVIAQAKDSVVVLSDLFANQVAPEYQPTIVEEEIRIVMPNAPIDFVTRMDLIDDRDIVTDIKTSGKKKPQSEVDMSEQLTFYALAYLHRTGRLPAAVRLENLVDKANPERQMLESIRTDRDLECILARINAMLDGIRKGVFIPALATSWQCDPRYCGYALTCPYHMSSTRRTS